MRITREDINDLLNQTTTSNRSINYYMADLNVFERFVIQKNGFAFDIDDFKMESLKKYEAYLFEEKKVSELTAERYISTLRKVTKLLIDKGYLTINYAAQVRPTRRDNIVRESDLSRDDLIFTMNYLRKKDSAKRALIFSLCINLRAKLNELAVLRNTDYDLSDLSYILIEGRKLPLVEKVRNDLIAHLQQNVRRHYFINKIGNIHIVKYANSERKIKVNVLESILKNSSKIEETSLAVYHFSGDKFALSSTDECVLSELFEIAPVEHDFLFTLNGKGMSYNNFYTVFRKISSVLDIKLNNKEIQNSFDQRANEASIADVIQLYFKGKNDFGDMIDFVYPQIVAACEDLCI